MSQIHTYVEVHARGIVVTKYRHHWQDRGDRLIKRWDNAPHHLHDGAEELVVAHPPVAALHILTLVVQSIEPLREA